MFDPGFWWRNLDARTGGCAMGQVFTGHRDDRGSPYNRVKRAASQRALAKRYGINQKAVAKWQQKMSAARLCRHYAMSSNRVFVAWKAAIPQFDRGTAL